LASVITNVQFDHQQWLGETLAQIAKQLQRLGVDVIEAGFAAWA
jgi:folylpolyglutamate synthase/dihydropteroate synthase